jgi:hypothetical protein
MDRFGKRVHTVMVAVLLCIPVSVCAQPLGLMSSQPQKSQKEILSSPNGRYVFGQISESTKDQFMLDTASGRLWRIAESGAIGIYLKSVPYRDEQGKCSPLPDEIPDKTLPPRVSGPDSDRK